MSPEHINIMVVGDRHVGKETFIDSISDPPIVQRGRPPVGHIYVSDSMKIHLFGLYPVWDWDEVIVEHMSAFCLLIDIDSANALSIYKGKAILKYLTLLDPVPHLIVANKQDREDAMTVGQIRRAMELPDDTIILPCVATERASVVNVLNTLLAMIRPD